MGWNKAKWSSLILAGLLTVTLCLGSASLAAGESFTKYATQSGSQGFGSEEMVLGPPDGMYTEDPVGSSGSSVWGYGYAIETGTITRVVIGVRYQISVPATDDTLTLAYGYGGVYNPETDEWEPLPTFGATQLTWVPTDTSWTEKTLDITSDTSVNGGSWDWTDISNLQIHLKNNRVGDQDYTPIRWVRVDALYMTITTGTVTTTPSPTALLFDFTVSASPASLSVQQSDSVSTTVSVKLTSGTAAAVLLSGSWVGTTPAGVTPSFSPPSGSPNFSSTLNFSTTIGATTGTFTYRVVGISGGITHTADVPLTITKLMPPVAPALLSPDNGVTLDTNTPTFDWADVVATSYTLEISTDEDFSHVILTKTTNESTAALSQLEALSYGTLYYWRVRGTNAAGIGDWSPTWAFTAKLGAPKLVSFQIAEGVEYINSTNVQLTISALNGVQMSFSSDGLIWSDWEAYKTSKSYTLSAPDGPKNIYVRVRDAAGDIGQSVMSSVILDQTPPVTTHFLSGDMEGDAYKGSVVVMLTVEELTSGVEETKYRIDNGEWETGSTFVVARDGSHTIEYYSTDAAGNKEVDKAFEVTVFTPTLIPPIVSQYWWAILSVIVVVGAVSTLVVRRMKVAGRLNKIRREKAELPKLKREAETKYFREGTISRETYDAMIKNYQQRKADLEKEERMLQAKAKREIKGRKAKRGVRKR